MAVSVRILPAVLVLLCLSSAASAYSRNFRFWSRYNTRRGFSIFNARARSFNTNVNRKYCRNSVLKINLVRGKKDYRKRIQRALDTLRDRKLGGTLRLSRGTFPIKGQLHIYSYTCLVGAGMNKTVIKVASDAANFKTSGAVRTRHSIRVTVQGLTIDGNRKGLRLTSSSSKAKRYGRYGFFSELSDYLWLNKVRIKNNYGYGFDPHGSKTHWAYFLLIENSMADRNGLDGFTLDQTYFVSLLNSLSIANDRHGINIVTGSRYSVIKGNRAISNGYKVSGRVGCGFVAQNNQEKGTYGVRMIANKAIDSSKAGILIDDVENVILTGNTVTNWNRASKAQCVRLSSTKRYRSKQKRVQGVKLIRNTCAVRARYKIGTYRGAKYTEKSGIDRFLGFRRNSKRPRRASQKSPKISKRPNCGRHRRTGKLTGVSSSKVCCPKVCGACGGAGCSSRPGGRKCCSGFISNTRRFCGKGNGAPCIL